MTAIQSPERGIIFTDTVPALLDGTKTQTRRLARFDAGTMQMIARLRMGGPLQTTIGAGGHGSVFVTDRHGGITSVPVRCPYGVVGDRIYCKEAHAWVDELCYDHELEDATCVGYRADLSALLFDADGTSTRLDVTNWNWQHRSVLWRSPLYMPRWAARLVLELTEIRVQRLQEITEEDARSEGMRFADPWWIGAPHPIKGSPKVLPTALQAFESMWDHINGRRRRREPLQIGEPGYTIDRPYRTVRDDSTTWARNPFVWALTFRRVETPAAGAG